MTFKKIFHVILYLATIYLGFEIGANIDYYSTLSNLNEKSSKISTLKKKNNIIKKNFKYYKSKGLNIKNEDSLLIIIGDSYLDNLNYFGELSYSAKFEKLSKKIKTKFLDLSKSGTGFNYFKNNLDLINSSNSILVYSFFVHDINDIDVESKTSNYLENQINLVHYELKGIRILKKLSHKIWMYLFNTPVPKSQTFKDFNFNNIERKKLLYKHFDELKNKYEKIYLILNFPFNYKYREIDYPVKDFIKSLEDDNLKVFFTNEIVNDPGSVGIIDGHPNVESVNKIFMILEKEILKFKN